jgi:hypothetical protein
MQFKITLILILLISQTTYAYVSVGDTSGNVFPCTYETIQEAVDDGSDEIRVTNNITHFENVDIIRSTSLLLKGGYDGCVNAAFNIGGAGRSIIDANDDDTPLFINISGSSTITIEDMRIQNGGENLTSGTGMFISTNSIGIIELNRVTIINNNAYGNEAGGGITIRESAQIELIITDSAITNNETFGDGGGILCLSGDSSIIIDGASFVAWNKAKEDVFVTPSGHGGGIALINGCQLDMYS